MSSNTHTKLAIGSTVIAVFCAFVIVYYAFNDATHAEKINAKVYAFAAVIWAISALYHNQCVKDRTKIDNLEGGEDK
jgi:hypothetical protein